MMKYVYDIYIYMMVKTVLNILGFEFKSKLSWLSPVSEWKPPRGVLDFDLLGGSEGLSETVAT